MRTTRKVTPVVEMTDDTSRVMEVASGMVSVMPARRFMDHDNGVFRTPTDEAFSVSRQRAAELKANGLVTIVGDIPANKMDRQPDTKG